MKPLLVFAGTSEGREVCEYFSSYGIPCFVCVTSEYGSNLVTENNFVKVLQGKLNSEEINDLLEENNFSCVVDATHPYACEVKKQIRISCRNKNVQLLRLARITESCMEAKYFDSISDAALWLKNFSENILVTTGSKNLKEICEILEDTDRVFPRVLPSLESLQKCSEAGVPEKNIIAMHGPFSLDENSVMLRKINARYLLTKETGINGGFNEKIEAALKNNVTPVVVRNPENNKDEEDKNYLRYSFTEVMEKIKKIYSDIIDFSTEKKIFLIGTGPGYESLVTNYSKKIIAECDIVFGYKRLLEYNFLGNKKTVPLYKYKDIMNYLLSNPVYSKVCVLFSGDRGFFSGANIFCKKEKELNDSGWKLENIPGISTVQYFAARLNESWAGWKILSLHGREGNLIENVKRNKKTFAILNDCNQINEIGMQFEKLYGEKCDDLFLFVIGYNLSYSDEEIFVCPLKQMLNIRKSGLYVLLVENKKHNVNKILTEHEDSDFVRGKVPMTKKEIRRHVLCSLELNSDSVVYDVGCGTGAVSVEIASNIPDGKVFAVDSEDEAVELTKINSKKFFLENLIVSKGLAPSSLEEFPAPTHVFIGGSKGLLEEIILKCADKSDKIRFVVTAITLETLNRIFEIKKKECVKNFECIYLSVSNAQGLGSMTMLKAENPIFIVSFDWEK